MGMLTAKDLLLKAITDPDFAISVETTAYRNRADLGLPDEASEFLFKPCSTLYRYLPPERLPPAIDTDEIRMDQAPPPFSPPATIVVFAVVAIVVYTVAAAAAASQDLDAATLGYAALKPLGKAARESEGDERFDLIRTLIHELTPEM